MSPCWLVSLIGKYWHNHPFKLLRLGSDYRSLADVSPVHPSQQSEKKSSLGPWLLPMFDPDYLVIWRVYRSSLQPPGLLLYSSGHPNNFEQNSCSLSRLNFCLLLIFVDWVCFKDVIIFYTVCLCIFNDLAILWMDAPAVVATNHLTSSGLHSLPLVVVSLKTKCESGDSQTSFKLTRYAVYILLF